MQQVRILLYVYSCVCILKLIKKTSLSTFHILDGYYVIIILSANTCISGENNNLNIADVTFKLLFSHNKMTLFCLHFNIKMSTSACYQVTDCRSKQVFNLYRFPIFSLCISFLHFHTLFIIYAFFRFTLMDVKFFMFVNGRKLKKYKTSKMKSFLNYLYIILRILI